MTNVWQPATKPFERLHVDFAGPFLDKYYFLLVDAFTKWPEVYIVKDMETEGTIRVCKEIFARFGLPNVSVSDNGRTFVLGMFEKLLKENGIMHKRSAPFHRATNGQVERYVQIIKKGLKKSSYRIKILYQDEMYYLRDIASCHTLLLSFFRRNYCSKSKSEVRSMLCDQMKNVRKGM